MLPKDRLAARQRLAAKGGGHRTAFHWQDGMAIEGFGIGGTRQFDQRRHDVDQMPRLAHERAACLRRDPARPGRDPRRREPTLLSMVLLILAGARTRVAEGKSWSGVLELVGSRDIHKQNITT